ncbi:MAG: NADP-specific glutamate dehydrogenase [Saprospiraceae bacterium]|nr:NADP-specific glutamate dehydrogenase [Saprospiraceae bacterium]MCF8252609.1 NADP-specific glutamate dehydrogenase [Saprospiraceae bacterium]MCF8282682.1 NADP-specific glutamate dehydrogenase [Bacteroidales bacterium]MCF8314185.1 NADP-specific glutamate dehydrogenase [Saprospiraceae bacterium]MCF8442961.1 NADP-specific glutamate dehydrogenase [Saprospiraceae bacterium]
MDIDTFMQSVRDRNPHEPEFHQAVQEWAGSVIPFVNENPQYAAYNLLERMTEPDRAILFRVNWMDDQGVVQVNKGYRVQFNMAIGPYKGGLRFHPSVNLSILKFLGFEQVFKNSLTTLPMGGGKGGSDFDPKGKSDAEIMRFCQAFMIELYRHIGPDRDVPAGDIGVGGREVGFLYGMYKKLENEHTGVITGKGLEYGGSLIRPEATGYGTVYFVEEMLKTKGETLQDKRCLVSGSGNVAQFTAQKILELGGKVLTLSDSNGTVYCREGITTEMLAFVMDLKNNRRGRIKEFAAAYDLLYFENEKPWNIACDLAFPCATQNEIDGKDAKTLVGNGCIAVAEGANMPTNIEGIEVFQKAGILYAPGKAANAGGVATSGLEMSQNSLRFSWTREEVDNRLHRIMQEVHAKCVEYGTVDGKVDYVKGANIAGFVKVANAMLAEGVV